MVQRPLKQLNTAFCNWLQQTPSILLALLLFCTYSIATLLAYSKALFAAPLNDDVAIPLYLQPARQFGWIDCFLPLDNGFIRPATMLSFKAIWALAGTAALPYHLLASAIHAAVATAAAMVFSTLTGCSRTGGAALGLAVALTASAFPTIYLLSNNGDSVLALGMLAFICSWVLWLKSGRSWHLTLALASILLAAMGKETAFVLGGVVILLTSVHAPQSRKAWFATGLLFVVCVLYVLVVHHLQTRTTLSYSNSGMISFHPVQMVDRGLSFIPATLFPSLYLMPGKWQPPEGVRVISKGLAALLIVIAVAAIFIRHFPYRVRLAAIFYLSAVGVLVPASIVTVPGTGRFVYAAIPLVLMALGCVLAQVWPRIKMMQRALFLALIAWLVLQVDFIRHSPGARQHYRASREYMNLVKELERLSPQWPPMQGVAVFTGEPYGSEYIPEPYGEAIMRVYLPTLLAAYFSNRTPPETTRAYTFNGKRLEPVPVR